MLSLNRPWNKRIFPKGLSTLCRSRVFHFIIIRYCKNLNEKSPRTFFYSTSEAWLWNHIIHDLNFWLSSWIAPKIPYLSKWYLELNWCNFKAEFIFKAMPSIWLFFDDFGCNRFDLFKVVKSEKYNHCDRMKSKVEKLSNLSVITQQGKWKEHEDELKLFTKRMWTHKFLLQSPYLIWLSFLYLSFIEQYSWNKILSTW